MGAIPVLKIVVLAFIFMTTEPKPRMSVKTFGRIDGGSKACYHPL